MCVWEGERSCWLKNLLIVVVELILLIVDRYWWWCNGFLFFLFLYLILSISIDEVGWLVGCRLLYLCLSLSLPLIRYTLRKENEGLFLFSATNSTMDTQHDTQFTCSHVASLEQLQYFKFNCFETVTTVNITY